MAFGAYERDRLPLTPEDPQFVYPGVTNIQAEGYPLAHGRLREANGREFCTGGKIQGNWALCLLISALFSPAQELITLQEGGGYRNGVICGT
jgi:hypothetical protein